MGTDIHLVVERYREDFGWQRVDPPKHLWDEYWLKEYERTRDPIRLDYARRWYTDRNYSLFAILADVRNGFGFAGTPISRGFKPISAPRGIPKDFEQKDPDELGDHSFSWLLVSELLTYDWNQTTHLFSVVPIDEVPAPGRPPVGDSCGWISGRGIRVDAFEIGPCRQKEEEGPFTHKQIAWPVTYAEAARNFYTEVLPELRKLGPPEKTRIVFGFDS